MPHIEVSGLKLVYSSFQDLQPAAAKKLQEIEGRLKKLQGELRTLKRQRRALKQLLEGKKTKPAPAAAT